MLSVERNETLTRFGAGTPMGELLRRYWWPVAISSQVRTHDLMPVRVLGEDLVLYRLLDGSVHLLEDRCPHRGAALSHGIVEVDGLRCPYHGWLFDGSGSCLEQPGEPESSTFAHRVQARAYPVEELGGLVFAYLGPQPAPVLPLYDLFTWDDAIRDVGWAVVPCNFVQIMENAVDLDHVAWLHGRYSEWLASRGMPVEIPRTFSKLNQETAFEKTDYGILMRRKLEGQDASADDWSVGHPLVFPNMLRLGGGGSFGFHLRTPIDDEHTLLLWYTTYKPGGLPVPSPGPVSCYEVPWQWEDGSFRLDHVEGQDIMAWVTQGRISDRSREHLGTVDRGVIMLRRMYFEQMERVRIGMDPMGVHRSGGVIDLPQENEKFGEGTGFVRDFLSAAHARFSTRVDEIVRRYAEVGLDVSGALPVVR
ncbi:phenoxybenzoate dioxygenase [Lentzea sp. NBRC 105346]|uniref:aromatic ring-hydroxylating dioxygenase subunit alpha n=1 Tax=Lentzea sp. NBRC 105346 TaxID=3032205 RepID=UPI00249FDB5F|nr:aromatic ring-hydroxylating dioxygenase subunit alpha [Lentzea sp. NBRC 105346]GLZ30783.1 phenoxybenzoate dioxygenase [Lentzea sp. NBRC 105346]